MIYEHSQGRPQPVQWLKDLKENKAVKWLVYGLQPSQTTLYEFRDRVQPLLEDLNQQVVRTAITRGTPTAHVAHWMERPSLPTRRGIGWSTWKQSRSGWRSWTRRSAGEERRSREKTPHRRSRFHEPEGSASPTTTSPGPTAASCTQTESWKAKTTRGKKRQRDRYRRARAVLQAQHAANRQRRKDKRKKEARIRVAPGDPMAPFGLDKLKTYRPLYNVQTMSDVETDLVLAYATTRTTADNGQLLPMIERTMKMTNRPLKDVLVDSGYPSGEDLAECKKMGVTVYAPWNENSFTEAKRAKGGEKSQISKDRFVFDPSGPSYRCPEGKPLTYRERIDEAEGQRGLLHD